jgi:hypothetical protein
VEHYTKYCFDKCYNAIKNTHHCANYDKKHQKSNLLLQPTNNNVYSTADPQNVELLLKQKNNNAPSTVEMRNIELL